MLTLAFFFVLLLPEGVLGRRDPPLVPIRYDLQIQLPTARSSVDPLAFFWGFRRSTRPCASTFKSLGRFFRPSAATWRPRTGVCTCRPPRTNGSRPGTELWLRVRDLESFENVTLSNSDQQQFGIIDVRLEEGFVVFMVAEATLVPGRYTLHIERYVGVITDQHGVFYRDVGGVAAIATNLFPHHADTVMPCLADPLRKASFRLSLLHPQNTIALSNTHAEQSAFEAHEHWKMSDFVQAANLPPFIVEPSSRYPIFVYTNRLKTEKVLPAEVLELAGPTYEAVYELLQEPLPFTHVSLVFLPELAGGRSTGLLFLDEDQWEEADDAHRIEMLAKAFIGQWIGGLVTIESSRDLCFQEDVIQFLTVKVVNRVLNSAEKFAQWRLAHYIRMQTAEVFFAPERPLHFDHPPDEDEVAITCGGRGAQMLESLTTVFGEDSIVNKIRSLIREFGYRNFALEDFMALLRVNIVDSVDLAQMGERIRLTQMNASTHSSPLSPIRVSIRNLTLPLSFMLSQGLDLAPLDSKTLPLVNLGYGHVYRVNYDAVLWERILRHLEDTPHLFSPRAKIQLLNDFCYFSSESEHFELCEFAAFWCVAARKGPRRPPKSEKSLAHLWSNFVSVLSNRKNYECAAGGNAAAIADFLCQADLRNDLPLIPLAGSLLSIVLVNSCCG
ncbi:hypothetical protein M3Y99_00203900 [Aphelenchoides fujianensis]|nr:hypothetical protein M3Y99_00203900 [Aphelenchoides fujianensis]